MTVGVLSRMTVPVDSGLKISGMTFTSLSFFTWYRNTFCHSRESGNPVLKESGSPIKLGMTSYLILDRRFQRWHNVVIIYILFVFYLYFICILFVILKVQYKERFHQLQNTNTLLQEDGCGLNSFGYLNASPSGRKCLSIRTFVDGKIAPKDNGFSGLVFIKEKRSINIES